MINNLLKIISEAEISQLALFIVLLTLIFIQIIFKVIFLIKLYPVKRLEKSGKKTPVSVLLTVRNEADNLAQNLPPLFDFTNADYEVVVVDDFSQDNSLSVLGELREKNSNLKVSSLNQETRFSVKLAQNIALKSAKNNWVMFIPPSINQFHNHWLENISDSIYETFDVIVHYSNVCRNGKFFNKLYRVETFLLYLKSIKYSLAGIPFVYFENNVVFRKQKYFDKGGYGKKIKEPFANLELLFNQFLGKKRCKILLNDETAIRFSEQVTRQDFFNLIKKSFRIEQHLSYFKRVLLATDSIIKIVSLPLFVFVMVLFTDVWPVVSIAVSLLLFLHLFIIKTMQNHLNERKIFITSLVYELIMPYYKVVFRWRFNKKSRQQNGRTKFKII